MGKYRCKAYLEGREIERIVQASSQEEAVEICEREGLIPVEIKELKEGTLKKFLPFTGSGGKVSTGDLAFAMLQLSILLEAGVELVKALEILSKQVENEKLSAALLQAKKDIERGEPIGKAFAKTGVFPKFLTEMLSSVQTSENLELVFKIAGTYLEKLEEIRQKVLSSITYPAVVIGMSLLAVVVAVKFVLPKMEAVLQSFGKDLPLFTKLVVGVVNALVYLPFALLILFPLLKGKLKDYPELVGRYVLKTPVVGKIVLYINLARFAAVMAMLLKAATPLNEALKMAVSGIGNAYLKKRLEELIPEVERGKSLSGLLSRIEILPPLFVNLVATGEESGELERAFDTLASLYEKETYRTIDFWVSMVEPLTIVLIAAVVGIIIVSVMLPLAEITTGQFLK